MATQSVSQNRQQRCGTLDDIPGLSDDIKRMYAILKRMESNDSTGSDIEDFDIEDFDSDDEELAGKSRPAKMHRIYNLNLRICF